MPETAPPSPPPEQQPEQPEQQPDGRARLSGALRRPGSRAQVVAAVLLAVLGFAAVTQVRSNDRADSYVGARQGDLIQYINSLSLASQRAQAEITKLERTRAALGNDTEAKRTALARARQQADTLGILAGTEPATGPGVRVVVRDNGNGVGSNQLIDGLQELRDAGAEVIDINGKVRVVAQTSVQDASGGGVLVDGTVLHPPYVLTAIGDSHTLATALDFAGGFISEVRGVGGTVAVKELDPVTITTVRKPTAPRYAAPGASR